MLVTQSLSNTTLLFPIPNNLEFNTGNYEASVTSQVGVAWLKRSNNYNQMSNLPAVEVGTMQVQGRVVSHQTFPDGVIPGICFPAYLWKTSCDFHLPSVISDHAQFVLDHQADLLGIGDFTLQGSIPSALGAAAVMGLAIRGELRFNSMLGNVI